jgi:hypothetical protein
MTFFVCVGEYDVYDVTPATFGGNRTRAQVAQLVEHWISYPKCLGFHSYSGVKQTFQLAQCGCTLRVTSQTMPNITSIV